MIYAYKFRLIVLLKNCNINKLLFLGGGFGGKKESGQLRFGGRDRPFRKPLPVPSMKRKMHEEEDKKYEVIK